MKTRWLYNEPYQLIYADPPWEYRDKANAGKRGVAHKYSLLNVKELCKLPVAEIAAPDCFLAMWWVPPQPREALAVMDAWGFKLVNFKGFTWHKLTKNGKRHFGMGHWTRGNSEDVLFAVRGRPRRDDAGISQMVHAEWLAKTKKPAEVRRRLERLLGPVPRIELFATEYVDTWDALGFELNGADIREELPTVIRRVTK